ncbi:iron complex outermembrane receptor protein [Rhizomicrobium palustre]|uniref:Iron complex outermembrane receptor protein n=1 Tax=Rhizomicrobium palustre TaxID=189966 RepID=A0A846MWB7_9PROT|nr:TonB-dependent receptor [Rhizomicrobium palustre]NIK87330.1 iron complex outermembrane receptor protein [Rhizomicrobium palustre]
MMKKLTLPLMTLLLAGAAQAQSMDYGAIAQLFGEPGTASATGSPQRATDVPANMVIVTADEIRRSGARDIPGVLRHVGGVDVLQWANDDYDVSGRGYNQAYSARTLVLVDGRQVYADSFGFTPWSALPVELSTISQIEIVKGPNAALFGFNAVSGVINIITKNPRYGKYYSLVGRYGSQSLREGSIATSFAIGDQSYLRLSAGHRSDKPFGTANPLPVDGSPNRSNERTAFNGDAVFALPRDIELEINASHSDAKQTEVSGGYSLQTSQYSTASLLGRISADTSLGLFKATAYTNWFDWSRAVGPVNISPKLSNTVSVFQIEDLFSLAADHTIRLAGEYRHNEIRTRDRGEGWIAFDAGSASAMWNWQILSNLSSTVALRFDSIAYDNVLAKTAPSRVGPSLHVNEWNFNTGLVWNVDNADTVRFLAARGVQLPNLVQVWDAAVGKGPGGVGKPPLGLVPSTVNNFEILWNHRFEMLDARLQTAIFHQDTYDVLSIGSGTFDAPGTGTAPANIGSSHADGLEMELNGRLNEAWRWQVSYRFETIKDRYVRTLGRTDVVSYQNTTPQHVLKAGLGWDFERISTDLYMNFQSQSGGMRRVGTKRVLVPVGAFTALDARIAYRLTDHISLALSGQNLFDDVQQQTSGPNVERQFFLTLSLQG